MQITPTTAPRIAEGAVAFVRAKFAFELIYTPESLLFVDAVVDKIRETGATEEQASSVLAGLGCYAGEVLVRHARASWRLPAEMGLRGSRSAVVLALPGEPPSACDPIGGVFQRFGGVANGVTSLWEAPRTPDALASSPA
jgi:hypothetical protein